MEIFHTIGMMVNQSPKKSADPKLPLLVIFLVDFRLCLEARMGSRANRIKQKLQSSLEASTLEIQDVSCQHAGHAGVKGDANETHFNIKVVSPKFTGQSLIKRHRMVYDLLADELKSGLHAVSIVAKTPEESGSANI